MNWMARFFICMLLLALTACISPITSTPIATQVNGTPDTDAAKLISMSEIALQIARRESPDVILRQVDTDLNLTDFRFVDNALTKEIMVVVPELNAPADKWYTVVNSISPLLAPGGSALNIEDLKVGSQRVAQAILSYWPGCSVRGITLYQENDQLTWVAFCNTSRGVVSGSMDNHTGVFQPSDTSPGLIPITATPVP